MKGLEIRDRMPIPRTLLVVVTLAACAPVVAPTGAGGPARRAGVKPSPAPSPTPALTAGPPTPGPSATPTPTIAVSPQASPPLAPSPVPTVSATFGPIAVGALDGVIGRRAADTRLYSLYGLDRDPAGNLYLILNGQVARIGTDGVIARVMGGRRAPTADPADIRANEVHFRASPFQMALDLAGHPLVWELERLVRVEADGRLTVLWQPGPEQGRIRAVAPRADGGLDVLLLEHEGVPADAAPFAWHALAADGQTAQIRRAGTEEAALLSKVEKVSHTPNGGDAWLPGPDGGLLTVLENSLGVPEVHRLDPATGAVARLAYPAPGGSAFAIDARGRLYGHDSGTGELMVAEPGGIAWTLAHLPKGERIVDVFGLPDGTVYVGTTYFGYERGMVYRVAPGKVTPLTGAGATDERGATLQIEAWGLAAAAPDDLYVGDRRGARILRVRPGRDVEVVAGGVPGQAPSDGAKALAVGLKPEDLAIDAAGRLLVLHGGEVYRLEAGVLRQVATAGAVEAIEVDADGALWGVLPSKPGAYAKHTVERLDDSGPSAIGGALDGVAKIAARQPGAPLGAYFGEWSPGSLADNSGRFRGAPDGAAAGTPRVFGSLIEGKALFAPNDLARDAKGRWYYRVLAPGSIYGAIARFDPATGEHAIVVGPGTPYFAGDTVAGGLFQPGDFAIDRDGGLFFTDYDTVKYVPGLAR